MASWKVFAEAAPELAAFGKDRFETLKVAFLATTRKDGRPRVHPVTPIIGDDLWLFMEPTSPKGNDLKRNGHYALHSLVTDSGGSNGEFYLFGTATFTDDPTDREKAVAASPYAPAERYILFKLEISSAFSKEYDDDGRAIRRRWDRM